LRNLRIERLKNTTFKPRIQFLQIFLLVLSAVDARLEEEESSCNIETLAQKTTSECENACENRAACLRALNLLEEESVNCECDEECSSALTIANAAISECVQKRDAEIEADDEDLENKKKKKNSKSGKGKKKSNGKKKGKKSSKKSKKSNTSNTPPTASPPAPAPAPAPAPPAAASSASSTTYLLAIAAPLAIALKFLL